MRKILILFVLLGIVFNMTISAYALDSATEAEETTTSNPKVSKEQAIELAKKTIKAGWSYNINDRKHEAEVKLNQGYSMLDNKVWTIKWRMTDDETDLHIDAEIDAETGMTRKAVFNQYTYGSHYSDDREEIDLVTNEEAMKIAEKFIKKISPDKFEKIELLSSQFDINYNRTIDYNYFFIRKANGAKVNYNYIYVIFDGEKKEITDYHCSWSDEDYLPSTVIGKDDAMKIVEENLSLSLKNIQKGTYYDETYQPVYAMDFKHAYAIDAKEGKVINEFGEGFEHPKSKKITDQQKEEIYNTTNIKNVETEISEDKATEIIKKYVKDIYGEGYKIDEIIYLSDNAGFNNQLNRWSATFGKQAESDYTIMGFIEIDAMTERLLFTEMIDGFKADAEEENVEDTWEVGYDKAIEIIRKYYPDKIKVIETELTQDNDAYSYSNELKNKYFFFRLENGIIHEENGISIIVDEKDQTIKQVKYLWDDVEFEESKNIISKDEAAKIFLEGYEPELIYLKINSSKDRKNPIWETKLTYTFPYQYYSRDCVNAVTGEFLDQYGSALEDRDNHDPQVEVSRMQAIKMLLDETKYSWGSYGWFDEPLKFNNLDSEDENYEYIGMAVKYGLIENIEDEFKGTEKITREELAEMIVSLLGYDSLAKRNEMYKTSFSDSNKISKEKIGYVVICNELGIMKTQDRKFRPKDKVKAIEIAMAIVHMSRYLDE